jgi:hypothetical protein
MTHEMLTLLPRSRSHEDIDSGIKYHGKLSVCSPSSDY